MNLTNEERLQIAKENGIRTELVGESPEVWCFVNDLLTTCAAIEAEVEKRVKEECAKVCDEQAKQNRINADKSLYAEVRAQEGEVLAESIRNGGVK